MTHFTKLPLSVFLACVALTAATAAQTPAATPVFSLAPGTYTSAQLVWISDSTVGASIHYTTDGKAPTQASPTYTAPIPVAATETLSAIAVAAGYSDSAIASASYTINLPAAATPVFSVPPGTYTTAQTLSISDSTPGASIYYSTEGTATAASTLYAGPFKVSASTTLSAVAVAAGYSMSAASSASYAINIPVATPVFSVAPGTYTSAQSVSIGDSTPGASIYYTTKGTATAASTPYSGPISVAATETLSAIAVAAGYSDSAVASASYTINLPAPTPNLRDFDGTVTPTTNMVKVKGVVGDSVTIYSVDASASACDAQVTDKNVLKVSGGGTSTKLTAASQTITLAAKTSASQKLCLQFVTSDGITLPPGPLATVGTAAQTVSFVGNLAPGTDTVNVQTSTSARISVFAMHSGYTPGATCTSNDVDAKNSDRLKIGASGGISIFVLPGGPFGFQLTDAVQAGTKLCLKASPSKDASSPPSGTDFYSAPLTVTANTDSIGFVSPVQEGTSLSVAGTADDTFSLYSAPAGTISCAGIKDSAPPLPFSVGTAAVGTTFKLGKKQTQLTLVNPVKDKDTLCLDAKTSNGADIYSAPERVIASTDSISFVSPVGPGNVFNVAGTVGDTFSVYKLSADAKDCKGVDTAANESAIPFSVGTGGSVTNFKLASSPTQIKLANAVMPTPPAEPLAPPVRLCLAAKTTAAAPVYSTPAIVASTIQFTSTLFAGSATFSIQGDSGATVSIFQFPAGYKDASARCSDEDRKSGRPVTSSGTNSASTTVTLTSASSQTVTLTAPLQAGTELCLLESPKGATDGDPEIGSNFETVQDYGRFQISFTGGVMISNEQQSTNSSTASQYVDGRLVYTWARAGSEQKKESNFAQRHSPGLMTYMDGKLTSVPVATTTTTSTTTSSAPNLSTALNALSSQQSVRVSGGLFTPIRLTRWYHSTEWLTFGPIAEGGFDTLLNPTAGNSSANANTTATATTGNFSSVYSHLALGTRLGWETYSKTTDEAPLENSYISITLGSYSNLQSYVCTSGATAATTLVTSTTTPTTACGSPVQVTGSSPTQWKIDETRKRIPRLVIAGELVVPNLPVVVGLDANLGQYNSLFGGKGVDFLNKPGNDVRFYIGLRLDVVAALKKLNISAQ